MKTQNARYYSVVILCFIFFTVLAYNFYVADKIKYQTDGDALEFIELGVSLAKNQQFSFLNWPEEDIIKTFRENQVANNDLSFAGHNSRRTPIWPLMISAIFLIFGYKLIYLIIFKFFLHIIGSFIFYKTLCLLRLKPFMIVGGTALYALSPASQLYSRVFLSEPVTFFFITLWLYLLIRFYKTKSGYILQAVIAGFIILSHPYYIFLPISVFFFLYLFKQFSFKTFIFSSLICFAVVSFWVIRNFVVLENKEVVFTTSSGTSLAIGWNRNILDHHTNTQGDLANKDLVLENYHYDKNKINDEVQSMQLYKNASIHFIKTNTNLILPIIKKKLVSAFNPFPETPKSGFLEIGRAIMHLISFLAIFYIIIFTHNPFFKSLVLGLLFSTVFITIITYSGFRFRMPQSALEMIFILVSFHDIYKRRIQRI